MTGSTSAIRMHRTATGSTITCRGCARTTSLAPTLALRRTKTNKTFIDYFLPTPIVGSLTTNIWGAVPVGPRDPKNGLEDGTMKKWNYWDGKIIEDSRRQVSPVLQPLGIGWAVMGHGMARWRFMPRAPISAGLIPTRVCAGRTGIMVPATTCPPCN